MLLYKQKKNQVAKGKRFLISVTVLGSAGPIRFVVNEEELVAAVIDTALKSYAREGRLPILGSDLNDFLLYCRHAASDAISPWETIGSLGARNFMLCKKPQHLKEADDGRSTAAFVPKGGSGSWKAWINKSLNLKIPSLDIIYSHQVTFRSPEATSSNSIIASSEGIFPHPVSAWKGLFDRRPCPHSEAASCYKLVGHSKLNSSSPDGSDFRTQLTCITW
ncbi:hypothetical protein NC653_021207 [Populus alba x Populus x berolinensis]|uniref:DUF7054 domain-containing protein n=1 Tax=Populus alba x Populus x berolinensis TaxID=444605 RepID=A0AAD6MMP9_9ROSI|nr:hypothetical protein NC653_021207 [Populus alba x Populus x berolinensis]